MTDPQDELHRRGLALQARLPEPRGWTGRPRKDRRHTAVADDALAAADVAIEGGAVGLVIAVVALLAWLLGRRPKR